ncbi:hypothetical protein BHM03_00009867 [Ensete ventricosum]|nr:hypothetical protein BHM03_00009867 [Ensete ventricosum]
MISDKGAHLLVDRRLPGLDLARQAPRQEVGLRSLDVRWPDLRRLVAEEQVPIVLVDRPHERPLAEPPPLEPVLRVLPRGGLRGRAGSGNGLVRSRASPLAAGQGDRGVGSHGSGLSCCSGWTIDPLDRHIQLTRLDIAKPQTCVHHDLAIDVGDTAAGQEAIIAIWSHFPQLGLAGGELQSPFELRSREKRLEVEEGVPHLVI